MSHRTVVPNPERRLSLGCVEEALNELVVGRILIPRPEIHPLELMHLSLAGSVKMNK